MPPRKRRRLRRFRTRRPWTAASIAVGLLTLVLTVGVGIVLQRWQAGAGGTDGADGGAGSGFGGSVQTVTLYYVSEDGLGLVQQETPIAASADPVERARAVVEQQLAPAPPSLISPFPEGTALRAVYFAGDGSLFVDLSREVTSEHSGGSLDELFTVYALVNALVTNVPEVVSVQIMVEGREVDTLAGHIDLRQPLEPSFAWLVDEDAGEGDGEGDGEGEGESDDAGEAPGDGAEVRGEGGEPREEDGGAIPGAEEEEDETEGGRAHDDAGRTTNDRI